MAYTEVFMALSTGIRVRTCDTNWKKLKSLDYLIPPADEQQCIADFLDAKCAEIDALTADIQTQIDTLEQYKRSVITETVTKGLNPNAEMKDSGIQWIGNMPAHWDVVRGKYILHYMQKPVREDDGVITCFRDGEVTLRSNRREEGFTMSDKEIGYQGIDVGDLVVHGMDGFAGSIGISDSRERLLLFSMYWIPTSASDTSCIIFAAWLTVMCFLLWQPVFVCVPVTFGGTSWRSFPIRCRRLMSRMPS